MSKRAKHYGGARVGLGRSRFSVAIVALTAVGCLAAPAHGQIVNEATAGGSFGGGSVTSNTSTATVPLAPARRALAVTVVSTDFDGTVAGDDGVGPGDTLTFRISVANEGNITLSGITPRLESLAFAGAAHTPENLELAAGEAVTLSPGEAREFSATYTLREEDAYSAAGIENAVASRWSASAEAPSGAVEVQAGDAQASIAAAPALEIVKTFSISEDNGTSGAADVGDLVTYRYVVRNTGNVALSDVHVVDRHEAGEAHAQILDSSAYDGPLGDSAGQWNLFETTPASFGANADEQGGDAVFGTLGVGGIVTFTHVHRVTQEEFDAQ